MTKLVVVGYSVKAHANFGGIHFSYATSFPERLKGYPEFVLHDSLSGEVVFLSRKTLRLLPGGFIVEFHEIRDRPTAMRYKGWELGVSIAQVPPIAEANAFYYFELVGLDVLDSATVLPVGKVKDVIPGLPYDLIDVRMNNGELRLFPLVDTIVKEVSLDKGWVLVEILERL